MVIGLPGVGACINLGACGRAAPRVLGSSRGGVVALKMNTAPALRLPPPRLWIWLFLTLALLLVAVVRVRLIEIPLERDEGEYAYAGQLILQGIVPYKLAYTMKLPGTCAAYALLMTAFGQTITGIRVGLLLVNAATSLLVFLLARKLFDPVAGLAAAASYAVMSTSPSVLGLAAHATHFVVFFALAGTWLLLRATADSRTITLLASGTCFGLAVLMKQHGIFYGIFGIVWLVGIERARGSGGWRRAAGRAAVFCAALLLPFAAVCLCLVWGRVFRQFVFWTFTCAREYAGSLSLADGWSVLKLALPDIAGCDLPLWILALLGLVLVTVNSRGGEPRFFAAGFSLASALAVCPGFYFRPHYFILLLPALALLVGGVICRTRQLLSRCGSIAAYLPLAIFALVAAYVVFAHQPGWFQMSPVELCREMYGHEPFPESVAIAQYLRQHTSPNDPIAVLGSEPQIFFYAGRRSATGYIYTFPLMDPSQQAALMQADMIREIEATRPEYVVYVRNTLLWLRQNNSPTRIFEWADEYLAKYYSLDGVADPVARDRTEYRWGTAAAEYKPESEFFTQVYKRIAP